MRSLGLTISTLPKNLLEMQTLWPCSRPCTRNPWGGTSKCVSRCPPGDTDNLHCTTAQQTGACGPTVFINTVILEHSNIYLFIIVYDCFYTTMAELSSCSRDFLACKAKSIYCFVLYRKSLLTPTLSLRH